MSFSDLIFLFYFLPLFFAVYYIVPLRFKNAVLALGSAAFYFLGAGVRDCVLLGASVVLHYALARGMEGRTLRARRALLVFGLCVDLFGLVYFKYAAFLLENLGKLTGTAFSLVELALPLGISFTFSRAWAISSTYPAAGRRRKASSTSAPSSLPSRS